MFFYIIAGLFSAAGIFFLLATMNFNRVLWLDVPLAIAATALLVILFFGTFAGMLAAAIGGSIMSMVLYISKKVVGYQKPKWNKYRFVWVDVPPR